MKRAIQRDQCTNAPRNVSMYKQWWSILENVRAHVAVNSSGTCVRVCFERTRYPCAAGVLHVLARKSAHAVDGIVTNFAYTLKAIGGGEE